MFTQPPILRIFMAFTILELAPLKVGLSGPMFRLDLLLDGSSLFCLTDAKIV